MGMHVTPLIQPQPELTTSNLTADADLNMQDYDIQDVNILNCNYAYVNENMLRIVNCESSTTSFYTAHASSGQRVYLFIFNFIPSTYYKGTFSLKCIGGAQGGNEITYYKSDGTVSYDSYSESWDTYTIPDNTIAISVKIDNGRVLYWGYTNTYLPLPTTP